MLKILLVTLLGLPLLCACTPQYKSQNLCTGDNCYKSTQYNAGNNSLIIPLAWYSNSSVEGLFFKQASIGGGGVNYFNILGFLIPVSLHHKPKDCGGKMIFMGVSGFNKNLQNIDYSHIKIYLIINGISYKGESIITDQPDGYPKFEFIFPVACNSFDSATLVVEDIYFNNIKRGAIRIYLQKKDIILSGGLHYHNRI